MFRFVALNGGVVVATMVAVFLVSGCDAPAPPSGTTNSSSSVTSSDSKATSTTAEPGADSNVAKGDSDGTGGKPRRKFKSVELGSGGSTTGGSSDDGREVFTNVRDALKPLQILIGKWNGTSRQAAIDQPDWTWDLKTDPKQPALKIRSEKGKYVREGRLTFLPATQEFEFTSTDGDGNKRVLRGKFSEPVHDVAEGDEKPQRRYKLQLTEPEPDANSEQWRLVINQQENNRYILEVDRKRGSGAFNRVDTVNTQRDGWSFALSDTNYGEKTCVVSQGLGTTEVKFEGKSYWVCCSGCKAAFEDDPKKWIAKWEEIKKTMK